MRPFVLTLLILGTLCGGAISYALETLAIPPRRLAPYIEQRASGHNPTIVAVGHWMSQTLIANDRGPGNEVTLPRLKIGAQLAAPKADAPSSGARLVPVASTAAASAAFANARPGDVITFAPGRYRFSGPYIEIARGGSQEQRITVRATVPETVVLEFDMTEGFLVSAPFWRFENLTIVGTCADHSSCEHAFHVTGKATDFIARNNTISDFNAHFKINGLDGQMPDRGLIEANTLTNSTIRRTENPVTIIDLVAASGWAIRKNFLSDFIKQDGNQISYGGFAKGAGSHNVFENNIVLCEYRLRGLPGQRVGLSLGDGGTGPQYCRDKLCTTEQNDSAINGNLIAACSDDGIYINRSANSQVVHNTLIDTGGISIRYPESTTRAEGNLVDGRIRNRDGASAQVIDNFDTSTTSLYLGAHPVRRLFDAKQAGQFQGAMPRRAEIEAETETETKTRAGVDVPDLCGTAVKGKRAYGAFADFLACLR